MDIKQLRYFLEMADRLSFRETAEALYISQSALSRQISELEKELGAKLFRRSTRKVELTDEGHICLKNAQRIIDEADDMKSKVIRAVENPSGNINIGCYDNGRHTLFYELLYRLQSKYRMINVNLTMGEMPDIKRRFERNELDVVIALRASFADSREIEFITVGSGQLYAVLPEGHRFAGRDSIRPEELRDENVLIKNEFTRTILDTVIKEAGLKHIAVSTESNSNVSNMIRVALGEGIMLTPALDHETTLENTGTIRVPVMTENSGMFDEVIARKRSNKNSAFICLAQVIKEYAKTSADAASPLPMSGCM